MTDRFEEEQQSDPRRTRAEAIDIEEEMKRSYLDYSMSVIVSRALPDVRDGLKPVHRRILYSMYEQNLTHRRPYRKSATVVGDVLGKYHPHGDAAVYDSMVRMAQDFSLLHPLVDGQGNFGSIDGDPAAAYRYTEARMSTIGEEMLRDIDKETVEMVPNFDDRLKEPSILPAGFPNLLVNGSSGIAVGMATNIPPHNLREVVDACCRMIKDPGIPDTDLFRIVKGPDFPTGGIITGVRGIREFYRTGHGSIRVRGRFGIEQTPRGREAIIITEIPYQVNKTKFIESIADLVKRKKIVSIADLRDESDREGMRIVVELKKDVMHEVVLNQLYKHTALARTFGANCLALCDGTPRRLSLRECILDYLEHRHNVIQRRVAFDLEKAEARAHIVEGLLKAQDSIDEVISVIRSSKSTEEAKPALMERFGFTDVQAQAILDMRLRRLTGLEREELENEYRELRELLARLRELAASRDLRMRVVSDELREVAEKYGCDRKTRIEKHAPGELSMEDLIPDDEMVITVSREGYIKRLSSDTYKIQHRGGKGITGATTKEEDSLDQIFVASNHSYILFFTNRGRCYWLKVYQVPEIGRTSKGKAIVNLIDLAPEERPVASVCVKEFDDHSYIVMATSNGLVKKTPLASYSHPRKNGIWAIRLDEDTELVSAELTGGSSWIFLALAGGKANRFSEEEIRPMGRHTRGVRGIRIEKGDSLVGMVVMESPGSLMTVTEGGFGKRTSSEEYRLTHRGSAGVVNIRNIERNGPVISIMAVSEEDELILISAQGMIIRLPVRQVREMGRNTMGVRLMNLPPADRVVDAARVLPADQAVPVEVTEEGEQQ
ncbi:MAG: DNA gyrase subunit A [Candidatus Aegiribacteria sp. MLS_C]|nr:MAG: DNA gyrase subunit A [Candidatus Aegiribacteria sp. MLS_C]